MCTMAEQDWSAIETETKPDDPTALRDITDPIYHSCWWRGEYPIDCGNGYDLLAQLYHVSGLDPGKAAFSDRLYSARP
jgi:hypothetical protein